MLSIIRVSESSVQLPSGIFPMGYNTPLSFLGQPEFSLVPLFWVTILMIVFWFVFMGKGIEGLL